MPRFVHICRLCHHGFGRPILKVKQLIFSLKNKGNAIAISVEKNEFIH